MSVLVEDKCGAKAWTLVSGKWKEHSCIKRRPVTASTHNELAFSDEEKHMKWQYLHKCECILPSEIIAGDYKPISKLEVGDVAVGIGGLTSITKTFKQIYAGQLLEIKAMGCLPFQVTPNHPILAIRGTARNYQKAKFGEMIWKPSNELVPKHRHMDGDYLVIPRIRGNIDVHEIPLAEFTTASRLKIATLKIFPLNEETAWLLGLYAAEGCGANNVYFGLNSNEIELKREIFRIAKMLGFSPRTDVSKTEHGMQVRITSQILARAFQKWCGVHAANKMVPEFILFHHNLNLAKSFLSGYLLGDGMETENGFLASTVSRLLASQLQLLCARLGLFVAVHQNTNGGQSEILGRPVMTHPKFILRHSNKKPFAQTMPNHILTPIRKISRSEYAGPVHNIETQGNTYLVSNVVVHNCGYKWRGDKPMEQPWKGNLPSREETLRQMQNLIGT